MKTAFRKRLLDWYQRHHRKLPWRETRDPYAIWISEVMLQQTRVAFVLNYYERFLLRFPTIQTLAQATEQDLLQAWAGLGYYSRARNLQRAARTMNGVFPRDYDAIRALPGVGDYTAAAVASIAFDTPHAAVDGNVLRVLSRVNNDPADVAVRKHYQSLADELCDRKRPGSFNQAMMELGATVCLPREPQCLVCPVAELCEARRHGTQKKLPVKLQRVKSVKIDRNLLIVQQSGNLLFWQQPGGFWELPEPEHLPSAELGAELGCFRHSITNHRYTFCVLEASLTHVPKQMHWLAPDSIKYLFSTTTRKALRVAGLSEQDSGGCK